ncbi:MAG: single-stranded-DNA-specific exonuclease RecJ [Myxococcales bacterium]|nr:single-stranded-DNA-specific exonuclease RecJ [Myxococcales bacterium]
MRRWRIAEADQAAVSRLRQTLDVPELVARLLHLRGLDDPQEAQRHLRASLGDMPEPGQLADIDRAAERLVRALRDGEKITVYGDYDVDGVTSSAVLWLFFRDVLGVEVDVYIPHRLREGYGLNRAAIERLVEGGTRVLVTVDNGSSAVAEVEHAQALGADVIIIDHHQVSDPEPSAYAHLNPHRKNSGYPDRGLAAVGVVFLLLVQVRRHLRASPGYRGPDPRPDLYLDLVALGTVADVAPLVGVNRAIVRYGLRVMGARPRTGVAALMEVARCTPDGISARDLGFRLGPRINAAGRLDDAARGLQLLIGDDPAHARALAQAVEGQNRERQTIQARMVDEAIARVEAELADSDAPAVVLAGEDWYPGVVGIVASRVVERFHRPAILLARDGDLLKGSARSTGDVDIKAALDACAEHLLRYGGHVAAAGMTLRVEKFEAFRDALCDAVGRLRHGPPGPPALEADAEIALDKLSLADVEALEAVGPFGHANPSPSLISRAVRGQPRPLRGGHLKIMLDAADGPCEALAWNREHEAPMWRGPVDLFYSPRIEQWRGRRRLVLRVLDMRPAAAP